MENKKLKAKETPVSLIAVRIHHPLFAVLISKNESIQFVAVFQVVAVLAVIQTRVGSADVNFSSNSFLSLSPGYSFYTDYILYSQSSYILQY